MPNLRIVPKNDHDDATLTTSAAAASSFAVTNTQNRIRSRVWRTTSAAGQYISGVLPASSKASFFGMFGHRAHGGSVKIQLFSDAAWTTSVYDSTALAISNITAGGPFNWGALGVDPLATSGPYWKWFSEVTYRSYRITFSGAPTSYAYWQVARFFLGNGFEVTVNPDYGSALGFVDDADGNRSRGGSHRASPSQKWRTFNLNLGLMDEADRAVWHDIMNYCGRSRDFVLSLYPEDGTRLERDHMMNAVFLSLDPIAQQVSWLTKNIRIEEV